MVLAVTMGHNPRRPQQLEYMDTAIKVTVSTSFHLSVQFSKLGTAEISCLLLGGGQRSGLRCKDIAQHYFRSTSVVRAILREGQLGAGNSPDGYLLLLILYK